MFSKFTRLGFTFQFKEFLGTYNKVTENCFMDCVKDFTTRDVKPEEVKYGTNLTSAPKARNYSVFGTRLIQIPSLKPVLLDQDKRVLCVWLVVKRKGFAWSHRILQDLVVVGRSQYQAVVFVFQSSCSESCLQKYLKMTQRISMRFQEYHIQQNEALAAKAGLLGQAR